jgi:Protein of unknown function (DUF3303)
MLFMVIERFRNQDPNPVYRRLRDQGRMLPEGVTFINSWMAADLGRCFQLMECDNIAMLQAWVARWSDLIESEIVPVTEGKETAAALGRAGGKA